ncbi:hypothetical protein HPB47_016963 [Ixodes persulcatus]|uniref:Uncharacterized protein n=1 Tax=Ixodes persulcatus TaxID=34615 RepID=A0AC60QPJ3_IXOPE|nr:hypothetical protein HPB47_016963 [Ixodes persulcatus]
MGATSRCHTAKRPNRKTKLLAEGLRNARSRSDPPVHTTAAPPRTSGTFPCRRLIPLLLSSMRRLFYRLVAVRLNTKFDLKTPKLRFTFHRRSRELPSSSPVQVASGRGPPRLGARLKKCWGNLKQKWKNERSDERRKTHKTGGGPPPTPMSAISVLVGAVAGHMATRLDNDNDSDGAAYLPPVQNEPVVRLLEGMVDCDPVYEYAGDHYQPASPSMDVAEPGASSSTAAATEAAPDPLTEQTTPAPAAASSCSSDRVAATPDEARPPRGRMVLLEQALSAENDVRSSLLRAESAIRIKLLEEEQQIKAAEHQMKVAEHQMKVAEHRVRLQVEQTNLKIAEWKLRELQQGGEK